MVAACGALTDLPVRFTEAIIKGFIHDHVTVASELNANLKLSGLSRRRRERESREKKSHARTDDQERQAWCALFFKPPPAVCLLDDGAAVAENPIYEFAEGMGKRFIEKGDGELY